VVVFIWIRITLFSHSSSYQPDKWQHRNTLWYVWITSSLKSLGDFLQAVCNRCKIISPAVRSYDWWINNNNKTFLWVDTHVCLTFCCWALYDKGNFWSHTDLPGNTSCYKCNLIILICHLSVQLADTENGSSIVRCTFLSIKILCLHFT